MARDPAENGTGSSAGVAVLRQTLETPLFPERIDVRTRLGAH